MVAFERREFEPARELLHGQRRAGCCVECCHLFDASELIDLCADPPSESAANDALECAYPNVITAREQRRWLRLPRRHVQGMMLHCLRFSLAYGDRGRDTGPAENWRDLVQAFLGSFGPESVFMGPSDFGEFTDQHGALSASYSGYASYFGVTPATFECVLVALDWQRVGVFIATDED